MAKTKTKTTTPKGKTMHATAMHAAAEKKDIGHVRVELPRADFEQLRVAAHARGLGIAAYARQALLFAVKEDKERGVR